jgi:hypothetical protein
LYPATLLKRFMVSSSFLVSFSGSFRYKIMSSANRGNLTSYLPTCILLFLLPALLLWLRIPRLCWIGVRKVDTLVSFLTLVELFQFFPINLGQNLWCWLLVCHI